MGSSEFHIPGLGDGIPLSSLHNKIKYIGSSSMQRKLNVSERKEKTICGEKVFMIKNRFSRPLKK